MRPPSLLLRVKSHLSSVQNIVGNAAARVGNAATGRLHMHRPALPRSGRSLSATSRRQPPSLRRPSPQSASTGIGYLDTWMSPSANGRRSAPATAPPPRTSSNDDGRYSHRPGEASPATFADGVPGRVNPDGPTSAYEMLTLRPTEDDTPESLLEKLDRQMRQQQQAAAGDDGVGLLPLVLDLSSFDPPVAEGTLTELVSAIRSYQSQAQSKEQSAGCSLVGVTNLPPGDRSMAEEARSLNLPILRHSFQNDVDYGSASFSSSAAVFGASSLGASAKPKRKVRGWAAPLLRPRRPGVASTRTSGTVDEDAASTTTSTTASTAASMASTLTTKDGASITNDVQIVGTGKLSPRRQNMDTKVHVGSVRSGQLVSSDGPNQSVVVVGSVNPGGEVWSEGDVYVFGKLRGRVLAGLSNVGGGSGSGGSDDTPKMEADTDKGEGPDARSNTSGGRIFATSFDPELVGIGNAFTTVDDVVKSCGLEDGVGPAMVTVDETTGELVFERMEL